MPAKNTLSVKKISVIGCGRWGCFLAWYLGRLNHQVTLYGRENSKKFNNVYQSLYYS